MQNEPGKPRRGRKNVLQPVSPVLVLPRRRGVLTPFRGLADLVRLRQYLKRRDAKLKSLSGHPLLAECSRSEVKAFARYCDEVDAPARTVLARQGWIGHWFFLIEDGEIELTHNDRRVAVLGPGGYLGDVALFGGGVHPTTARALGAIHLFVIHRRHLAVLIDRIPALRRSLTAAMVRRLRESAEARGDPEPVLTPDLLGDVLVARPRWLVLAPSAWRVRLRRVAWVTGILGAVVGAMSLYHPPVAVLSPGPSFDVSRDITISGVPSERPSGSYLLTAIRVSRPSVLGLVGAAVLPDREVVSLPSGVDLVWLRQRQRALFRESQLLAAAAAARNAGMKVGLSGTGALVTGVLPDSDAEGVLETGDVILAVDGRPVSIATDLEDLVGGGEAGRTIRVTVERAQKTFSAPVVVSRPGSPTDGALRIGTFVQTRDLKVDLPFEIRFRTRDLGGPSAGLVYAIAISDMLDQRDYAQRRTVAATGVIDPAGRVGPVGGVRFKAEAARRAGAWIFLVPTGQVHLTAGEPLLVFGVQSLKEALATLGESRS